MSKRGHSSESWEYVSLGDVCVFKGGSGFKESFQGKDDGDYPFIKVSDLNLRGNEKYVVNSNNWVSAFELKELKAALQPIGATVFAKVGAALKLNRRRLLVRPTAIDNNMMAAIPDEKHLDREYLYFFLLGEDLGRFSQESAVPSINQGHLESIKIPLPPLVEQRKIAEILRTWDEAIETAEAELKAKQERKRWLMDKLIDEGSVRSATGNYRIKSRLREIASMASGGTPKTSVPEYYGGSIPWVSISDMTSGTSYISGSKTRITEEGLSNSSARIFKKGTILFAMYASIGECRIAGLDLTTSQAILGITPGPSIRSEYLYYFLCRIKETAKSYGQTGTQANLNKGIVGDFEISLPTLEEQDRILDVLKTCDTDVEKATMMISALRTQKRALMQKLLTGEVRVAA